MLLKLKSSGALVEACSLRELTDPCKTTVTIKHLKGYRHSSAKVVDKSELVFVSGEDLPGCWMHVLTATKSYSSLAARLA